MIECPNQVLIRSVGGYALRSVNMLLGAYSSGKTSNAIDLVVSAAEYYRARGMRDHVAVYATYEESPDDILCRLWCRSCFVPEPEQRGATVAQLYRGEQGGFSRRGSLLAYEVEHYRPGGILLNQFGTDRPGEAERFELGRSTIAQHVELLDLSGMNAMTAGAGSPTELIGRLNRIRDQGRRIGLVVVDHVLEASDRWVRSEHKGDMANLRHCIQHWITDARDRIAREFGPAVWLLHHYSAQYEQKPVEFRFHHSMAAECKTVGRSLEQCLCLSPYDRPRGVGVAHNSKVRRSRSAPAFTLLAMTPFQRTISNPAFAYSPDEQTLEAAEFTEAPNPGPAAARPNGAPGAAYI